MKLLRLLLVPFALLCVLILRLLKGRVRIGTLWTQRIGHFAGNVEIHLCERDIGIRPKCIEIWCAPGTPCSKQLLKMWGRILHIDHTGFAAIVLKVNKLFDGWRSIEIPSGNIDRDVNNLLERYAPHLEFTPEEKARGEAGLRRLGIPPGAKWVCLIVRDNAYLPNLTYHNYRDSDINTYEQAVLALVERDYYVIRMGAKVAKPLSVQHPRVIDFSEKWDDFMSVYLGAHCAFCLSNGCGFDAIPVIFRRPICYVNYVPLEYLQTYNPGSLAIWKHHEKDGKRMTPAEIWTSGAGQFMRADEYEQAGIKLVDNTVQEITDATLEMTDGLSTEDQSAFWSIFPRSISPYTQTPLHGEIRMRIGREFLREYQ